MPDTLLILRWLLVAAVASALFAWYRSGMWRRFPAFAGYLLLAGTAAAAHVRMEQWPGNSWVHWQYVLIGLRALAGVELVIRATEQAKERGALRSGLLLLPAAVLILAWGLPAGGAIEAAAAVSRHVEAGVLMALAGVALTAWIMRYGVNGRARIHGWLYAALMANQVAITRVWETHAAGWWSTNAFGTAVAILCAAGWALAFSGADVPAHPAPHSLAASR